MKLASLSSSDTLQLSLSPASFESIRDILELVKDLKGVTFREFLAPSVAKTEAKPQHQQVAASAAASKAARVDGQTEQDSLFRVCNRTGVTVSCKEKGEMREVMQLTASSMPVALKFKPPSEVVYVPDFGRKVCGLLSIVCL